MCGHDGFIRLFGGFLGASIVNENEAGRVRSEHQVVANHVSVDDVVLVQDVKGHGDVTDEPQELVMPHKWPRNCVEPRVQGAALDFRPSQGRCSAPPWPEAGRCGGRLDSSTPKSQLWPDEPHNQIPLQRWFTGRTKLG